MHIPIYTHHYAISWSAMQSKRPPIPISHFNFNSPHTSSLPLPAKNERKPPTFLGTPHYLLCFSPRLSSIHLSLSLSLYYFIYHWVLSSSSSSLFITCMHICLWYCIVKHTKILKFHIKIMLWWYTGKINF